MKELVSIVVPVYNVQNYLSECLDRLLCQTYKDLEIICINDCSTDNSLLVLKEYQNVDNRVKIFSTKINSGLSICRNIGIENANGKYIMFCDGDDYILETAVSDCILLKKKYKTDAIYFNIEQFYPDNTKVISFSDKNLLQSPKIINTDNDAIIFTFTNAVCGFFDLDILKNNNIKFPEGKLYEDWVFMTKFHMLSVNILWYDIPLYKYRRNRKNSLTQNVTNKCLDMISAYKTADKLIEKKYRIFQMQNDLKIIDNGILFLKYMLFNAHFSVRYKFSKELSNILSKFPNYYFLSIIKYAHPLVQNDIMKLYILLYKKRIFLIECLMALKRCKQTFRKFFNKKIHITI